MIRTKYIANILIVDDKPANLLSIGEILSRDNIRIFKAKSGNEALKMMLRENIDIVLLDVQMPDMDGFEVAELMRANKRTCDIPIIFITAISKEEKYIFRGYELGAVDYIYKPITNEILRSKVNVFIKIHEQNKMIEQNTEELKQKIKELEEAKEKLKRLATLDGLTGINNRRTFDNDFYTEWFRCIRNKEYISIIMIDIDKFKYYNDTYGHLQGDECLKIVARTIRDSVERFSDKVARYGGEEFVVLLPETDAEGAFGVAEKIRTNIEQLKIEHKASPVSDYVTVSLGLASVIPMNELEKMKLLNTADEALYEAKDNGRNRTVLKMM